MLRCPGVQNLVQSLSRWQTFRRVVNSVFKDEEEFGMCFHNYTPGYSCQLFFFFFFFEAAVFLHTRTPMAVFIPTAWSLENVLLFLVSFIVWHLLSSASSMSHLHLLKSPSFSPSSVTSCFFPPSNKVNCHVSAQSTREQREAFGGLFDSALSLSFIFFTNLRHPHNIFFHVYLLLPCILLELSQ